MLSDEEKEEALSETEIRFRADLLILNSEFPTHRKTEAMEELLEIYNKQSKEIEEYKKQLDLDYVDKHFVPIERYNQLEKEIEELTDKNKKLKDKAKELIFEKQELTSGLLDSTPNDKIKAKIEELNKDFKEYENGQEWEIQDEIRGQIDVLQSLLEKE